MTTPILPLLIEPNDFHQWQQDNVGHENIRIIDLSSKDNFNQGHIQNALHLPYEALLLRQPPHPGKLPSKEQLINVFNYLGLSDDTHFVVCDDEGGGWAGRFIWTLDIIGHHKYTYINGGMLAWNKEGLPLEQVENSVTPSQIETLVLDTQPRAQLTDILARLTDDNFRIWDARSPDEHFGRRTTAAKNGRIPGAINCEWTSLMDPTQGYKIRVDAQQVLSQLGLDTHKAIVTHCQTHHRSGFTYLVGKILGFNIQAYDGSWSEWGNHPETPVES